MDQQRHVESIVLFLLIETQILAFIHPIQYSLVHHHQALHLAAASEPLYLALYLLKSVALRLACIVGVQAATLDYVATSVPSYFCLQIAVHQVISLASSLY
jgi:hypothetical protein